DVGQLDDVGLGRRGELAQLGQRVGHLLVLGQPVGEGRQDAPGERDVAGLDPYTRLACVRLDDRQERVRREQRGLVGVGVDDGRVSRPASLPARRVPAQTGTRTGTAVKRYKLDLVATSRQRLVHYEPD